jgi:hypothetical protein
MFFGVCRPAPKAACQHQSFQCAGDWSVYDPAQLKRSLASSIARSLGK